MVTRSITYETLFGENVTETFYFNMTKTEILEWMMQPQNTLVTLIRAFHKGDVEETKDKFMNAITMADMSEILKDIVKRSYIVKNAEGRFYKDEKETSAFLATDAYSTLFFDVLGNTDGAANFINELFPPNVIADVQKTLDSKFNTGEPNATMSAQEMTIRSIPQDHKRPGGNK